MTASLKSRLHTAPRAVAFFDIAAQTARLRSELDAAFARVMDHGAFIQGPEVETLEKRLAEWTGAADCIACASGTDALVMALMAMGVGPGDAVFVPAFTYNASANAILLTGARPVFVDVDPATAHIDLDDLRRRLSAVRARGEARPRALMSVDLYGAPADAHALNALCAEEGLLHLSDAAQSFGAALGEARVGALAPITATSFYPTKALGCLGDGGAIFLREEGLGEALRGLRWHGTDRGRKLSERVGLNGRLDTLQAAALLVKLDIFEDELARRRAVKARYDAALGHLRPQTAPAGARPNGALYTVRAANRDDARARLNAVGVPTAVYYDTALHRMPAFAAFAPEGGLPGAELLSETVLSLPMHPYLADEEVERVIEAACISCEGLAST